MGYNLIFVDPSRHPVNPVDVVRYFSERSCYDVEKSQAWYENPDTGVYFAFDLKPEVSPEDREDVGQEGSIVAEFNLNYCRPHIFGLEAEPEIASFVETFRLSVQDPQIDGMTDGTYISERFLCCWNRGNENAYRVMIEQYGMTSIRHILPGSVIEHCWRWNLGRKALQDLLGDRIFVPKIIFIFYQGRLRSAVVWPDGMPAALPGVDLYLIAREEYTPLQCSEQDVTVVSDDMVAPAIAPFAVHPGPLEFRLLDYIDPPKSIIDWIRLLPGGADDLELVPVDDIGETGLVGGGHGD